MKKKIYEMVELAFVAVLCIGAFFLAYRVITLIFDVGDGLVHYLNK